MPPGGLLIRTVFVACLFAAASARAQPVADFYRGKTINVIVSSSPGGDYDVRARLVARHMDRHIPGNPKIVVQNMPGGGGLRGINHVYRIAPRDGTVIGAIDQQAPLGQAFGDKGVEYDLTKSSYIGNTTSSPIVLVSWHTSPVKTFADALKTELVMGATGAGSASVQVPLMINALIGTKFRVVSGYPGGNEIYLAMENGEVAGRATQNWAGWKSQKPDWLRDKKINLLAQAGAKKHPELPDTPLLVDFAKNDEDRQILRVYFATADMARPLWVGPDVPAERVEALRRAFDATMVDREFLDEARRAGVDIEPTGGVAVQAIVAGILGAPPAVLERARRFAEAQ